MIGQADRLLPTFLGQQNQSLDDGQVKEVGVDIDTTFVTALVKDEVVDDGGEVAGKGIGRIPVGGVGRRQPDFKFVQKILHAVGHPGADHIVWGAFKETAMNKIAILYTNDEYCSTYECTLWVC